MKQTIILAVLMALSFFAHAQAPQMMNYQAVVRNAQGQILSGTPVSVNFKLHNTTANGNVIFDETITTSTNAQGLVVAGIGGTNQNLATVNWGADGAKFLQILVSINGDAFTDMGTTQLLSVPYALFAANSAPGPQGPAGANGARGATGFTGATGAQGTAGVPGPQGPAGTNGLPGVTGPIGLQGPTGAGATGPTGPVGPAGSGQDAPGTIKMLAAGYPIPTGYALCDGTNGTPNLVDQFVIGGNNTQPSDTVPHLTVGAYKTGIDVYTVPGTTRSQNRWWILDSITQQVIVSDSMLDYWSPQSFGFDLAPGTYMFVATDSAGNGWTNGPVGNNWTASTSGSFRVTQGGTCQTCDLVPVTYFRSIDGEVPGSRITTYFTVKPPTVTRNVYRLRYIMKL